MLQEITNDFEEVVDFFEQLWGKEEGYSYLALKNPDPNQIQQQKFKQHFFKWPDDKIAIIDLIANERSKYEVYFAPALFKEPSGTKEAVKGASCAWVEFDGKTPTVLEGIPEPSIRICSSTDGHEHWYWKLDSFHNVQTVERINRLLSYTLGADISGWDASQILRPPKTFNHKRSRQVTLVSQNKSTFDPSIFSGLEEPPPPLEAPVPDSIPEVTEVVAKYKYPTKIWQLFQKGMPEGKRSDGLMSLGYYLAELQLTNEEILSMLLNADARWGKFAHRNDQLRRLMEVVTRARAKYPLQSGPAEKEVELQSLGLKSLLATEIKLEWVWEEYVHKQGYVLITGPSGIGKSQFSLDAAAHMALGRDFLDTKISTPRRIGFFSLEMSLVELKDFIITQAQGFNDEELETLEKNLRLFPIGEPIYLNRDEEKKRIEAVIEADHLDGVIIDSLGSTTDDELSSEKPVKDLMDWNDHLRNEKKIFTWFIHHHRKASGDNKKPNKLSDVYGSQYITARSSMVLCLWDQGIQNSLQAITLKIRSRPKPEPYSLYRDGNLHFTKKKAGITIVQADKPSPDELEKPEKPDPTIDTPSPGKGFGI